MSPGAGASSKGKVVSNPMGRGKTTKSSVLSRLLIMVGLFCLFAAVGLAGFLVYNKGKSMYYSIVEGSFPSCPSFTIWSHRGHVDAQQVHQGSCAHTMTELHGQGIRHFDVDVLMAKNGVTVVAHPAELENPNNQKQATLLRSPCAEMPLKEYIRLLKVILGSTGFFVTVEPKADWNNDHPVAPTARIWPSRDIASMFNSSSMSTP